MEHIYHSLGKTLTGGMQSFIGLWHALYISLAKFIGTFLNIHDRIKVWCNIKWENLIFDKIAKSAYESNLTLQGRETKTNYNLFTVLYIIIYDADAISVGTSREYCYSLQNRCYTIQRYIVSIRRVYGRNVFPCRNIAGNATQPFFNQTSTIRLAIG